MKSSCSTSSLDLRVPVRFTPVLFAFFMSGIMAMLMSIVIVGAGTGIDSSLPLRVWHAYKLAMPVAFFCVLMVRPLVARLVAISVRS